MTNVDDLLVRISSRNVEDEELWISSIDLKYAYGHRQNQKKTSKPSVFSFVGGKISGLSEY